MYDLTVPSAVFLFVGLLVSYSDLLSSLTLGDVGTRCKRKSGLVSNPEKNKTKHRAHSQNDEKSSSEWGIMKNNDAEYATNL